MLKFIVKVLIPLLLVIGAAFLVNMNTAEAVSPTVNYTNKAAETLSEGNIVEITSSYNETLLLKDMIENIKETPSMLIAGSSHIMYLPAEEHFGSVFNAGLSSAKFGDLYGIIGMFEYCKKEIPSTVVFTIEPWCFSGAYNECRADIRNYTLYAHDLVTGSEDYEPAKEITLTKMLSISGIQDYFSGNADVPEYDIIVSVSDNKEPGEYGKILPNGLRIMGKTSFKSVEFNDNHVQRDLSSGAEIEYYYSNKCENLEANLAQFDELRQYLTGKGIKVEFYLPSIYPTVYDYILENVSYSHIPKIEERIRAYASENSVTVRGSYDPYVCGAGKEDFANWFYMRPEGNLKNFLFIKETN